MCLFWRQNSGHSPAFEAHFASNAGRIGIGGGA